MLHEPELIRRLKKDENLKKEPEKLDYFISLATLYLSNITENLYKHHFDLQEATDISFEDWHAFLTTPTVTSFREEMILEITKANVGKSMSEDGDNKKSIDSWQRLRSIGGMNDRSKLIYSRLPLKKKDEELVKRVYVEEIGEISVK